MNMMPKKLTCWPPTISERDMSIKTVHTAFRLAYLAIEYQCITVPFGNVDTAMARCYMLPSSIKLTFKHAPDFKT